MRLDCEEDINYSEKESKKNGKNKEEEQEGREGPGPLLLLK